MRLELRALFGHARGEAGARKHVRARAPRLLLGPPPGGTLRTWTFRRPWLYLQVGRNSSGASQLMMCVCVCVSLFYVIDVDDEGVAKKY